MPKIVEVTETNGKKWLINTAWIEIISEDDKAEKEFNRLANLSEDVIRHMIIRL